MEFSILVILIVISAIVTMFTRSFKFAGIVLVGYFVVKWIINWGASWLPWI